MSGDILGGDILVGVEFEFQLYDEHCECPYCEGHSDDIWCAGWHIGWDASYREARSAGPQPLNLVEEQVLDLQNLLSKYDVDVSWDTSHHVHVNCDPNIGPALNPQRLLAAYLAHIDEFTSLVDGDPDDRRGWAEKLPYKPTIDDLYSKCLEFNASPLNWQGSVELRLWNSTLDQNLTRQRFALLRKIFAHALT